MHLKYTSLFAFLAILSLSGAYKITPNVIDGVPGFLNITTAPFVKIGSNYYFIESNGANWYAAFESCKQKDADLIAFESLEELQLISQYLINNNMAAYYWTSGTDLAKQDKHVWFSNGRPVASDLWRKGEPNNENDEEHCDELKIEPGVGVGLNDRRCSYIDGYICKAPQPKTASFIVW
ncbi:C-type lectin 37Da-like [Drosophila subpulchrella]|uniref:C-type lectin 37Da-like n=1 Tax=Drosophila subpulchrella TaxID=1486046 RepID=UPI0018A158F2|nr:C-type lectin 37Da-like [Drosophila subpulchrella]